MTESDPPIFIVGTGRSGTTLLRLMLNAHPRIHLTHEASFYLGTRRPLRRAAGGQEWLDVYLRSFAFQWLGIKAADVRAALPDPLPRAATPDAFHAVMRLQAERFGKERWGDKTPFHAGFLSEIFRDFPDARVIHIVRDPRTTVASLTRMPWAPASRTLNTAYWRITMNRTARFNDRIHHLRLEDLLTEPRQTMEKVLEFVGEPWDDRVLDHATHAAREDTPPYPWLTSAFRPIDTERARTVAADPAASCDLPPEWVRIIEAQQGRVMAKWGYEPWALDREPRRTGRLRANAADVAKSLTFARRALPLFAWLSSARAPDAAEAQRRLLALNPQAWTHYPDFDLPPIPDAG